MLVDQDDANVLSILGKSVKRRFDGRRVRLVVHDEEVLFGVGASSDVLRGFWFSFERCSWICFCSRRLCYLRRYLRAASPLLSPARVSEVSVSMNGLRLRFLAGRIGRLVRLTSSPMTARNSRFLKSAWLAMVVLGWRLGWLGQCRRFRMRVGSRWELTTVGCISTMMMAAQPRLDWTGLDTVMASEPRQAGGGR